MQINKFETFKVVAIDYNLHSITSKIEKVFHTHGNTERNIYINSITLQKYQLFIQILSSEIGIIFNKIKKNTVKLFRPIKMVFTSKKSA